MDNHCIIIDDKELEEFRNAIPAYSEYLTSLVSNPMTSKVPFSLDIDDEPPLKGSSYEDILKEYKAMNIQSTDKIETNMEVSALFGHAISLPLNNPMFTWLSSPLFTELELNVMDALAKLMNLPKSLQFTEGGVGVINYNRLDGYTALFYAAHATIVAHDTCHVTNPKDRKKFTAYVCGEQQEDHLHIERNIDLCGFTPRFVKDEKELEKCIESDIHNGLTPISLNYTVHDLTVTNIDKAADIAEKYKIWLHLEAGVNGLKGIIDPTYFKNITRVDSLSINGKSLFGSESYFFWIKNRIRVTNGLSFAYLQATSASYLNQLTSYEKVIDYKNLQLYLGKKSHSLKVWTLFNCEGIEGVKDIVRKKFDNK